MMRPAGCSSESTFTYFEASRGYLERYGKLLPFYSDKDSVFRINNDATGRLIHLRFGETESAFDYMMVTREYLEQHGKPLAFYRDKHSIFRGNNRASTTIGVTQFGRLLSELGIELICANSPHIKSRVERVTHFCPKMQIQRHL